MKHYYTDNTDLKSNKKEIYIEFENHKFSVITDNGVFSMNKLDFGTEVMLKEFLKDNKFKKFELLDIGCGYGPVSLILSKYFEDSFFYLSDVNDRALELSKENLINSKVKNFTLKKSFSFDEIDEKFDIIISNPPIRAGKQTIFNIYENSYNHLKKGGKFYCVIQTKHGAKSTEKKLLEIFGNCKTLGIHSGYRVYMSEVI